MRKTISFFAVVAVLGLAACGDSDLERGVSGAAIGAVGSTATWSPAQPWVRQPAFSATTHRHLLGSIPQN